MTTRSRCFSVIAFAAVIVAASRAEAKVSVCHLTHATTNPVVRIEVDEYAVPAHEAHGDAIDPDFASDPANCSACGVTCAEGQTCADGQCADAPSCTEFILSGGTSSDETIGVDDDVTIYLNGIPIFVNADGFATEISPISFTAENGDALRVVASDVDTFCRGIEPLHLHCATGAGAQVLDADGQLDGCVTPGTRPPGVFYDQTFTIDVQ